MESYIHSARKTMEHFINPDYIDDKAIPPHILKKAKGIALITEIKAGFIWSGMLGRGIVLARRKDTNTWSGPVAIGTGGVGWGAQIGGSKTNAIVVLNTSSAVKAFAGQAQVKLGGDLSVAAGPLGRTAAADVRVGAGLAACYSYSHSQGLFAGIALEGALLVTLDKDDHSFYGQKVSAKDILYGDIPFPITSDLQYIYDTLNKFRYEGEWDSETPNTPSDPSFTPPLAPPGMPQQPQQTAGQMQQQQSQQQLPGQGGGGAYSGAYQSPYNAPAPPTQPPVPAERQTPVVQSLKARANFDFYSTTPGDLSFRTGDVLNVVKQDGEWWVAEKNGAQGLIPGNYVSLLQ